MILAKLLKRLTAKPTIVTLTEEEAKDKIKKWKNILKTQDDAIDKIEQGTELGNSWLEDLPDRINSTKSELVSLKNSIKSSYSKEKILVLGKQFISKERLLNNLIYMKKTMEANLKLADLQFNRLQDRAVEMASKIQESEIYLALSGSLKIASEFIAEIEQPINKDNMDSIISFKNIELGLEEKDEISDEEVLKKFSQEVKNADREATRSDTRVIKTKKSKSNIKRKR